MKWKQRLFSLLLCGVMLFSLCTPAAAVETGTEKYLTWDDAQKTLVEKDIPASITQVTTGTTELNSTTTDGWYIVRGNIEISSRVTVTGAVHLILADGYNLTVTGGINVGAGNSLTIYGQQNGTGVLTAQNPGDYNAGIGGGERGNGGKITINGGVVTATNELYGAGIGGGSGGEITINSGKVTATGGDGAGIGGGYGGSGGKITINGGEVTATCKQYGAGIGGGNSGDGGQITINGGKVTATSELFGAGIGGGNSGDGGQTTINGGKVTATSELFGAGIGGGNSGDGGRITINGGEVTATCNQYGAGIGGGYGSSNGGAGGIIISSGGEVKATGEKGAGIGGGYSNNSGGAGGQITISGGEVTATGINGAGIGGGNSVGNTGGAGGTITITGGEVTATGSGGAGVGGGSGDDSGGAGGAITITGGTVTATGNSGAGIGGGKGISGDGGNGGTITITGGTVTAEGKAGADIGGGVGKGDVVALSDKIEIGGNATVKGPGGRDLIIGSAEHEAKDEWVSDSTHHWHPCKKEGCADRFGQKAHDFGDWTTDTEATAATAGSKHRVCSVCQYQETQTIPATGGGSGGSSGGGNYTPPTTPTYPPTVEKPGEGGGTPVITPSNPKQGDTVTVKPKPDEGYEVDKITVTDRRGKDVEVTKRPNGTYTFIQPGERVTIEIEYAPVPLTGLPWSSPFSDVSEGDWYYEAVRFVHERGLMNGYSNGRFGPNETLSRTQLAQILFNKEDRPVVNYLLDFSDVSGGAWYTEAIRWAASQGIVGGYGNGTFGPNGPITREQLAVMLWRYSGSPAAADKELLFADAGEINPFAREAMRWAVENGILNGYGNGRLGPQGQATRAQVAQMLKNFIENQEEDT